MSSNLTPVTAAMLDGAASNAKDWLHSNGNYENSRYYAGNQINTGNVAKLANAVAARDDLDRRVDRQQHTA